MLILEFYLIFGAVKYKQQITVFIVGQCEAIQRKNMLLEQLNDVKCPFFIFLKNQKNIFFKNKSFSMIKLKILTQHKSK